MKLETKSNKQYKHQYVIFAALALCFIGPALAVKPVDHTPPLVGHLPVAVDVLIDKPTATLGETLAVNYTYIDVDGDAEAPPAIEWFHNGVAVSGQTARTYTPALHINTGAGNPCTDFTISAKVSPRSLTGDLSDGAPTPSPRLAP